MSLCESCQIYLDERARYDNDLYFKIVENVKLYCKVQSLKTGVIRKIVKNDKFIDCIVNEVTVNEVNLNYDFSGLGQNGVSLYSDPHTLYDWTLATNVPDVDINSLIISSWGGTEGLYNSPYLPIDDRALGIYFSSAIGKYIRPSATFTVPEGNTQTTFTIIVYSAWNRFPFSTPRWEGVKIYIDGDSSNFLDCTITNIDDPDGTTWYSKSTSYHVSEKSKTFLTEPGEHILTLSCGDIPNIEPPDGYTSSQHKNVHLALDNIKLEFS